jgi:hypothetical protein
MDVVVWLRSLVGGPTVKSDRALFGARAHLRSENFFRVFYLPFAAATITT